MSENGDEILHYKKRIIQMHENPINRDENSNLDGAEARGKRDDDEETGGGKNKRKESDSEDWESQRQDKSGEHQPKRRKNARNLAFSHEKLELYKLGESRNSTTLCKTKEGYRASQEKILRSTSQTGPEPRVTTQQLTDSILLSLGVDKTKDQESEETNNLTENLVRRLSRENSIDNSIQTTVIRKECSLINSAEITNKVEPIIAPINQTNTEKVLQETNSNTTIKPLSPETKSHLPPRKPSFGMEAILEDVRQTSFPLKHTATITHIPSNNLNEIEDRFIDHNERQGLKVTRVTYRPPSPKFFGQPEVNYPPSASQCSAMDLTLPVKEPVLNKTKKTERQDTRVVEEKIRKVQELESGTRIRVSKSLLNRPVPVTPVSTQYLPPNHRNVVSPKHQQPLLWCGQNEVAQRNRISPREAMIPPNSYVLPMQNYPPEPSRFSFHPDATGIGVPSWHGFPSPEISPSYLPQRDLFLNVRPESEPAVFYGRPEQTVKRQRGRPKGAVKKKKPEVQSVIMSPPQTPNGLRHPAFSPFHLPVQRPLEINNNTHPGTINQCLTSSNDSFCESDEKSSPNSHSRTVPSISAAHVNRMKTMFCGSKHLDATLERVNEQVFMFFSKHFNNACTDSFLKQLIAKCNSIFKSLILHLINMQSNSNNTSFVGTLNISTLKSDINTSLSNVKRNCELDINYLAKNFHIELLNVKKMDGLDLISHEPFITAVVDHLGNHIQTKFSHEVDFLSFKMFEIMVVKPPKNTPPHSPQSNTSPITVRSTDSLKNPSPICISERSNDGSELAETHKPTDSGYEGSVGKPLDEENSQITIIEDSQDTSHNSVASDKSGLKERMIEDISEDEVATTPLKPPETFPFLRSDSRLSVESISSSSDAGAASKPQKVVNVEKPYSKRIPKGKLCYIREQHYFIRYFDEAQIHLFIENLKKSDQSYNVKDIYKQCYKNGIRPEHVENVQNQMFKTGKEIIKVPPDCEFSDKDILAKPDEYVTEYNMVHKYVPEDFFWYYKFVTGYQIYRGNIPISFQTFLTMHNTNGLKVLFNNYINNLEQKYRETTTNNVSS
ncbi:uncharacterized protein LOC109598238 isoform X2 [Aethina tumida]|nr:uncharacterized protein LOC109598238 isoform X2 [Aethina tumida]